MRVFLIFVLVVVLTAPALRAEDADDVRERGIAALKDSQTNPHAIVDAARLFVKAGELYSTAGDEEKNVEMNSFLYWCKKKMTLEDIDAFTKGGESHVTSKLIAIEKDVPKVNDAQKWLDRAERFATNNPAEHLLIAIRFYEVADRFKGTDAGLAALDRSLKEQLLDKPNSAKPPPIRSAENANDPKESPGTARIPSPDAALIKAEEKSIREMLKNKYASSKQEDRQALVEKLAETAAATTGTAADKFAILREARDQALMSGNTTVALKSSDELFQLFVLDETDVAAALKKTLSAPKPDELPLYSAMTLALRLGDQWGLNQQYEKLAVLLPVAQSIQARLPATKGYAIAYKARLAGLAAAVKEWPECKAALLKLKTAPADAAANLITGRFAAFFNDDWEHGLPALALGADPAIKSAAEKDLANPTLPADQVSVGDAWMEIAKKQPPSARRKIELRALALYKKALPALGGLEKLRTEKHMNEIHSADFPLQVPPVLIVSARFGSEEKSLDLTAFYQKEFETNPLAAIYGIGPGPKNPASAPPKTFVKLLFDGRVENFKVEETEVYVPPYMKDGVPANDDQYKILSARVSAPRNWLDRTSVAARLAPNPDTSIFMPEVWAPADPWGNVHKVTAIWFEFGGKRYARIYEDTFRGTIRP